MNDGDDDEGVAFDDVECEYATEGALKVIIDGGEYWIPRSQVHDDSEVFDDGENKCGKLVIKAWFAKKKGLV